MIDLLIRQLLYLFLCPNDSSGVKPVRIFEGLGRMHFSPEDRMRKGWYRELKTWTWADTVPMTESVR
jgi:hypothetical protein